MARLRRRQLPQGFVEALDSVNTGCCGLLLRMLSELITRTEQVAPLLLSYRHTSRTGESPSSRPSASQIIKSCNY